jgi:hypothetical protein
MLWRIPSTSSHLTVLAFWVVHAENQEVILIYLRIGSDIVISTMASEMVEGEVPGNFLSAATALVSTFCIVEPVSVIVLSISDQDSLGSFCNFMPSLSPVWIVQSSQCFQVTASSSFHLLIWNKKQWRRNYISEYVARELVA